MKRIASFVLGVALLSTQIVIAHHSFDAEFDRNKPVTLKGSVTRVDWGNPHIWVFMDVKMRPARCRTGAWRAARRMPSSGTAGARTR
jgi:hypothetical protein